MRRGKNRARSPSDPDFTHAVRGQTGRGNQSYFVVPAALEVPLRLRVVGAPEDETVVLPASALKMLVGILDEMGRGNTVTVIPVHAELTTQEAADMLVISRPSLIQMLDEGKIEYRKVGTHRRVRFESVMAYKRRVHAERLAALNELAAYDQEIGI